MAHVGGDVAVAHDGLDLVVHVQGHDAAVRELLALGQHDDLLSLLGHIAHGLGAEVVYNHADYRLVSSLALRHFADFGEVNIFLRGMFPLVGFKSTSVYYERHERLAGSSHYSLAKMLGLAFDGITSLSIKPIRMIAAFGAIMSFLSFIGIIWAVVDRFMGNTVPGWASTVVIIFLTCGLQMLSLGVIGEYIGKIYMEAKHRPRYIISEKTYDDANESPGGNN